MTHIYSRLRFLELDTTLLSRLLLPTSDELLSTILRVLGLDWIGIVGYWTWSLQLDVGPPWSLDLSLAVKKDFMSSSHQDKTAHLISSLKFTSPPLLSLAFCPLVFHPL